MPLRNDDPSILNEDILLRRIPDNPIMITGEGTPSSANFKDRENELSVFLNRKTTPEKALKGHNDFGLVSITAAVPRSNSHIVDSDPIVDDENPENNDDSHCVVCPTPGLGTKATLRAAKQMAKAAIWVIKPKSRQN